MRAAQDEIARAGATAAAVGTGPADYAQRFKERQAIDFPLLVDEDGASYRAVGAQEGTLGGLVKPTVLAKASRAVLRGARQTTTGHEPLLLGATHVIRPDGSVAFAWRNADYADNAPMQAVLGALAGSG